MERPLYQEDVIAQLGAPDRPWILRSQCHPKALCDLVLEEDRLIADCADCAERIAVFAVVRSRPASGELAQRDPAGQAIEVWVDACVEVLARHIHIRTHGPGRQHRPPVVLRVAQRQRAPAGDP